MSHTDRYDRSIGTPKFACAYPATIFFAAAERLSHGISYPKAKPDAGGDHRWSEALTVMVDSRATRALSGQQFLLDWHNLQCREQELGRPV